MDEDEVVSLDTESLRPMQVQGYGIHVPDAKFAAHFVYFYKQICKSPDRYSSQSPRLNRGGAMLFAGADDPPDASTQVITPDDVAQVWEAGLGDVTEFIDRFPEPGLIRPPIAPVTLPSVEADIQAAPEPVNAGLPVSGQDLVKARYLKWKRPVQRRRMIMMEQLVLAKVASETIPFDYIRELVGIKAFSSFSSGLTTEIGSTVSKYLVKFTRADVYSPIGEEGWKPGDRLLEYIPVQYGVSVDDFMDAMLDLPAWDRGEG